MPAPPAASSRPVAVGRAGRHRRLPFGPGQAGQAAVEPHVGERPRQRLGPVDDRPSPSGPPANPANAGVWIGTPGGATWIIGWIEGTA